MYPDTDLKASSGTSANDHAICLNLTEKSLNAHKGIANYSLLCKEKKISVYAEENFCITPFILPENYQFPER